MTSNNILSTSSNQEVDNNSIGTTIANLLDTAKKRNLFFWSIQAAVLVVVADKVSQISDNPVWQGLIFTLLLVPYPLFLLKKSKELELKRQDLVNRGEAAAAKAAKEKIAFETKVLDILSDYKRLKEEETLLEQLKNEILELKEAKIVLSNSDKTNRERLENAFLAQNSFEAQIQELEEANKTLFNQAQTLSEECETLQAVLLETQQVLSEKESVLLKTQQVLSEKESVLLETQQVLSEKESVLSEIKEMAKSALASLKGAGFKVSENEKVKLFFDKIKEVQND